ncbi:UDP-glycosyltransferase 43-like [Tripterygium wilfordii]|uniref:UDP-glycosyltransferase 43-like n=1 Tax=Tripterygium wilfordii TaxID=458696 RepID=UPI0018F85B58|nr:UDP-glycosyltransferase 43-like [Tripterygium wilfordii]
MTKYHVFFVSTPAIGNLVPIVEFAHRLVHRDRRISATVLIITFSERPILNEYVRSRAASTKEIKFVHLPTEDPLSPDQYQSSLAYLSLFYEKHKSHVKHAITEQSELDAATDTVRIAGLFVDMFSTSMIDVANELGIPSYIFFASPASFLGLMLHLPILDTQLATELVDSETELIIPSFVNPLPHSVLPSIVLERKDAYSWCLRHGRRYREAKGIIVNTHRELESHAINSISKSELPPIYPVGPVLDFDGSERWHPDRTRHEWITEWLDNQPETSVVFLCFGSMGCLSEAQVKEIGLGLEGSGLRFLWSVREPPKGKLDLPGEYTNMKDVLPEGFLDRTEGIGLVTGWVPQARILAHRSIGGFVSHCGWNSILEGLWYGVPIATWPLYAEQQMNAFQLVRELGLAVEIRVDYRKGSDLVLAEELERGIKLLMDGDGEIGRKVKEMMEKSRMAVMENGSSYVSLGSLIDKLTANN